MSYTLAPLVDFLTHSTKFPHGVSITIALMVGLSILLALILVISHSIKDLTRNAKQYERYVVALSNRATEHMTKKNIDMDVIEAQLQDIPLARMIAHSTQAVLHSVLEGLTNAVLVLIFVTYLLEGRRRRRSPMRGLSGRIEGRIKRYVLLKFFISFTNGVISAAVYYMLNVDLAMVFGVFHFVLNFIPHVGPIVACLLPLPVVLVSGDSNVLQVLLSFLLPGLTHFLLGHLLEPRLMGDSLDLHPITVLLCLIFWGMLWGVNGMILAAPITAALKIVFESVEVTAPFALLLAGQLEARGEAEDLEHGTKACPNKKADEIEIGIVEGASAVYRSATTVIAQMSGNISGLPAQKVANS
jgi:AI-2 transport protein TqsA